MPGGFQYYFILTQIFCGMNVNRLNELGESRDTRINFQGSVTDLFDPCEVLKNMLPTENGPLMRYVKLQVAHAPGGGENAPGIPGACAPAILRIC